MGTDKTNRLLDNPIWGDGGGWAWFELNHPSNNTTTNYRLGCVGCQISAEPTDGVYLQGYPALK